jgi:hypothetical protein
MSAKRRGAKGIPDDAYPSPNWTVFRLLKAGIPLPDGSGGFMQRRWLEPAVGDGAIVEACSAAGVRADWTFVDLCDGTDYLTWQPPHEFDVAITNPPFALTYEFARKMRQEARHVLLLTRLNILESAERCAWLRADMPDVYVLPNRPSFGHKLVCACDGCKGAMVAWNAPTPARIFCGCVAYDESAKVHKRRAGNDATGYCWLHWHGAPKRDGKITLLAETPKSERVDRRIP